MLKSIGVSATVLLVVLATSSAIRIDGACLKRCNLDRPVGVFEEYLLDCSKEHVNNKGEQSECVTDCQSCPSSVCDSSSPYIFHCPEIERKCSDECEHEHTNMAELTILLVVLILAFPLMGLFTLFMWSCIFRARPDGGLRWGIAGYDRELVAPYQQQISGDPYVILTSD